MTSFKTVAPTMAGSYEWNVKKLDTEVEKPNDYVEDFGVQLVLKLLIQLSFGGPGSASTF